MTKHTQLHKDLIRAGIRRAQEDNRRSGRPINQWPVDYQPDSCDECSDPSESRGKCHKHYQRLLAHERGHW